MNMPTLDKISQETYLDNLLQQFTANSPVLEAEFLQNLRQNALAQVKELKLPTRRDEEWQFTDLSSLYQTAFRRPVEVSVKVDELTPFLLSESDKARLVFVNGSYQAQLSDTSALGNGVYVGNLAHLPAHQKAKLGNYLGQQDNKNESFTALNTADLRDIAIIWVNPNIIVETPIQLLYLTVVSETPTFTQPRSLIIVEDNATLQLTEHYGVIANYCSDIPQNIPYFTNAVTEIWLKDNARLNHTRYQRESGDGMQIGKTAIAQYRDSHYTINEINLGAKLSRHTLDISQKGEQTQTTLNGLTLIEGEQLSDTHSAVLLNFPYGTVSQLHKCIIDAKAHAVFNGKILVPQNAQLTNAAQLNRNLLLSPKARVNTKPELQITADNVKCSHGATVSQLEDDEVFYLRSRGLSESDARNLLIDAFAAEIIDRIPLKSIRQRLTQCVACRTF